MYWSLSFLNWSNNDAESDKRVLIILNQPFSAALFIRLWRSSHWRCCADGGANRLYDLFKDPITSGSDNWSQRVKDAHWDREEYLPDLIKGDLDSIRDDVRQYYAGKGVPIIHDKDQNSTDLMKCISSVQELENAQISTTQYDIILLGGLSGRLDQTIHVLSRLHKLRKVRKRIFAVTDENVAWVLDEGVHNVEIDTEVLGPTCGLLPVGVESSVITTHGLKWNLTNQESSFSGQVSTSNAIVDSKVFIQVSRPIWWNIELHPF